VYTCIASFPSNFSLRTLSFHQEGYHLHTCSVHLAHDFDGGIGDVMEAASLVSVALSDWSGTGRGPHVHFEADEVNPLIEGKEWPILKSITNLSV
jgi:hypothetical protein